MKICRLPYCEVEVYAWQEICDDCWEDRKPQLAALPDLYVMTYAMLGPGTGMQDLATIDVKVGSIDPAAPISLVAYDVLALAYAKLAPWAAWVARLVGREPLALRAYTTGRGFLTVVRLLQAEDSRMATAAYCGGYVMDVYDTYRRMVCHCAWTEYRVLDGLSCPECGTATMTTRNADEYTECLTCHTTWPHSQLSKLRRQVMT